MSVASSSRRRSQGRAEGSSRGTTKSLPRRVILHYSSLCPDQLRKQVIITRRGKPVAVLSPFDLEADPKVEEPPLRPFEEAWEKLEEALERSQPAFSSWQEALASSRGRKSSPARSRSKAS